MSTFNRLPTEDIEYLLNLPQHLGIAGMTSELNDLLTEFEFLEYKISVSTPQSLIEDYNMALQSLVFEKQKALLHK
jgi:APAF-1 helical domain